MDVFLWWLEAVAWVLLTLAMLASWAQRRDIARRLDAIEKQLARQTLVPNGGGWRADNRVP
jgi:hypothetical protein